MFKLVLEKAEEPEIKLPTSAGSSKKQESFRKTSISTLLTKDFILGVSKITVDGDCSHEIKRRLVLRRKAMTNLDSILKSRDITLPTKVCLVKAMVFPVVMYGCESWTIKKGECWLNWTFIKHIMCGRCYYNFSYIIIFKPHSLCEVGSIIIFILWRQKPKLGEIM